MMSDIRERVAQALYEACRPLWEERDDLETVPWEDKENDDEPYREMWRIFGDDAITTFLQAAAEQGWHMRPDEATKEMGKKSRLVDKCICGCRITQWGANTYQTMLAAAPEFKWRDE